MKFEQPQGQPYRPTFSFPRVVCKGTQFNDSMHRCLLLDEVLVQILHWVERPTLCSIARTCRAFNEPATALIWRKLVDLWPIFRLLPAAAVTWSELHSDSEVDHDGPPIVSIVSFV